MAKTLRCTLIEVNGITHVFVLVFGSILMQQLSMQMLEKLTGNMRKVGYHSETVTALYDVEEDEKECMIIVHIEKLVMLLVLLQLNLA